MGKPRKRRRPYVPLYHAPVSGLASRRVLSCPTKPHPPGPVLSRIGDSELGPWPALGAVLFITSLSCDAHRRPGLGGGGGVVAGAVEHNHAPSRRVGGLTVVNEDVLCVFI